MPTQNCLMLLLLLMLMLRIMLATVCYKFGRWRLVQTLGTRVGQDFEVEVCTAFCRWCLVEVMKLNLGRDSEAYVLWSGWCLVDILKLMLGRDSKERIWSRFLFELVIWPQVVTLIRWTQPSGPLCLWQCFDKQIKALKTTRGKNKGFSNQAW